MYGAERLKYPLRRAGERGQGKWQRITWDEALSDIADAMLDAIQEAGPETIIYEFGSGEGGSVNGVFPAWRLMRAILARMIEVAGPRRVVVAPLPLYHHIEGMATPVYLQRFRELAREHPGIELIDLLPYFQALPYRERRRCRYRHDPHYTPLAHRVVASALTAELSRRGIA